MILLIIAEDNESRFLIKNQLKSVSEITTFLECNSAEDALFIILEKEPNLIIVSNILPGRSGFELAYLLQKINFKTFLIILSNNPDNAIDAIKASVFDYLIYPFSGERLVKAVKRAIIEIENSKQSGMSRQKDDKMKVRLTVSNGFLLVDLNELSHCKADGSYTELFFTSGKVEYSSYYLGKLEVILREYHFVRINRSILINMKMLKDIDEKNKICRINTGDDILEFNITKLCLKKLEENHFN
jgi:two-component system, LytTR family, response regulator